MRIQKNGYTLEVIKHPQPFGYNLYETLAPDGYKWAGDTWSIHGDSPKDLRERVKFTDIEQTDEDDLI